ncbi:MAG: styrene monooxygenase/indole monooxygenase family protein [Paracoccaceae bacterium]
MSKVAIIGSGISGLTLGIGLVEQGHNVTIFTGLSGEDWLTKVPPTGTACRFASSLDLEEELGINHWNDTTPINGVHLTFCPKPGRQLVDLMGRFSRPALAIDVRLQSWQWEQDFEERGGKTVVGNVDIGGLEKIAAEHDITFVAAGKADIGKLFEVDPRRSVYDKAQRKLAMFVIRNVDMDRSHDGIHFTHGIKFNFFGTEGEQFSVPYWHKDGYQCWNCIVEAKEGRALDRFDTANSGEEVVQTAKDLFRDFMPWDYDWIKNAELADPKGWLKGSVRPCYKKPVGHLPSGNIVMAVGDTANTVDPIGGQGANNCYRQIRRILSEMKDNAAGDYSEAWMNATFDKYVDEIGWSTNRFNNTLLEPLTKAGQRVLIAQYGSTGRADDTSVQQQIANAFCDNFDDPNAMTDYFHDDAKAKAWLDEISGGRAGAIDMSGKMSIAKGQLRQVLGMTRSGHPLAKRAA